MSNYNQPFDEQLAFFRQKLNLPSARWDDIIGAAHDRGFIVAGAQGADLLADLRAAVDKAIEQGTGLTAFRKDFDALVARHGWTGWTGEGSPGGVAWRTKVIYQTNMATSYAAGRWKQLNDPELLKLLPYWKYVHCDSVAHPRPLHLAWNGLTLPPDHPFWQTHFPPNGWGCQCRVIAVSKADFMKAIASGKGPANAPTGTEGIDQGFDYAPGSNTDTSLRQIVQDKLITYPPAITKALTADVNRKIEASYPPAEFARKVLMDRSITTPLWTGFVENAPSIQKVSGLDLTGYIVLLPAEAPRHVMRSHEFDGSDQRAATPDDYGMMMESLLTYDSIALGDTVSGHQRLVVKSTIAGEVMRWVFEIRQGKRNRSLALVSLVIKTAV